MFSKAAELYRKLEMGQDVPLWFQFLTLRDQSGTLEDFLKFHLNMVGDSLGLEQVTTTTTTTTTFVTTDGIPINREIPSVESR